MFSSRKITQCDQIELIWDDRVVFLLSLSPEEGTAGELQGSVSEDTVLITVRAEKEAREPCFGPQAYFDSREGIVYHLDIPETERFLAVYQHKDWWVRPAFFSDIKELPDRTQLLLFQSGATYFAVLSVCGEDNRTDMCSMDRYQLNRCSLETDRVNRSGAENHLAVRMASNAGNRNRMEDLSLAIAGGSDPYLCCERAVQAALGRLGRSSMLRKNRKFPEKLEFFGWCTWDAFYHRVSHEGVMEKMREFRAKQLPVKWVLLDDGWLDADYDKKVLIGLDADRERFPKGLKGCVKELKETWNVDSVGVWHAVMGYWNGLAGDSPAAETLKAGTRVLPDGRILPDPEAGKAFTFFETWHKYLKNCCGIDFVKVDGQSAVSLAYGGMETYGHASCGIQKGLNASAALYFDNCIINCMGMAGEDMWNRPSSAVARSSDDFVPQVPHGFKEHAVQNSYNSLLQGQFYWGDWDMFFSSHEENWQNSILRAVSGGPVYVSDRVGETNPGFIRPLITETGLVIRCREVGMPTTDCLFDNPADTLRPLKIFNRYGENYVIGAFHICEKDDICLGKLEMSDIPELSGRNWLVYAYQAGTVCRLGESGINFSLPEGGAELFLLIPDKGRGRLIGILEKYISCGCLRILHEEENRVAALVLEAGTLGIAADRPPVRVWIDGRDHEAVCHGGMLWSVYCEKPDCLVEIEWQSGGL